MPPPPPLLFDPPLPPVPAAPAPLVVLPVSPPAPVVKTPVEREALQAVTRREAKAMLVKRMAHFSRSRRVLIGQIGERRVIAGEPLLRLDDLHGARIHHGLEGKADGLLVRGREAEE